MIRVIVILLFACIVVSGCGKKPNVLLPPNGNTRTDPAVYPYPMEQTPPPAPTS